MGQLTDEEIAKLIPKSVVQEAEKKKSEKVTELNDAELDKFLHEVSPEQYAYSQMGIMEKFAAKWNEGPLVFVFFGCTVGCLCVGLTTLKTKNQKLSQMMMRGRVTFQMLCVVSLVSTLGHQDQFMEGAKYLYDRKMGNEEAVRAAIESHRTIQRPNKSVTEIVEQVQREHREEEELKLQESVKPDIAEDITKK